MAIRTKQELLDYINQYIKQNNRNEITGKVMNATLIDIVDSLFAVSEAERTHIFSGVPNNAFGDNGDTYVNVDNLDLYKKEIGSWSKKVDSAFIIQSIQQIYNYQLDNDDPTTANNYTTALNRIITKIDGGFY